MKLWEDEEPCNMYIERSCRAEEEGLEMRKENIGTSNLFHLQQDRHLMNRAFSISTYKPVIIHVYSSYQYQPRQKVKILSSLVLITNLQA